MAVSKQKLSENKKKVKDTFTLRLRCREVYGINRLQAIFWSILLNVIYKKIKNKPCCESKSREIDNVTWLFDFKAIKETKKGIFVK